jgi:putative oxidoreductase
MSFSPGATVHVEFGWRPEFWATFGRRTGDTEALSNINSEPNGGTMNLLRTRNDFALAIPRLILGIVFFPRRPEDARLVRRRRLQRNDRYFESQGIPALFAFLAIAAEFFGSLGLILGFLSRIAAFGISVNMLVAVATIHARNGFFMNWLGNQKDQGFEYYLPVLGIVVMMMISGSGAASLDCVIYRNKSYSPVHRAPEANGLTRPPRCANPAPETDGRLCHAAPKNAGLPLLSVG